MATEGGDTSGADDNAPAAESFRLRVANLAWGTTDESFKEFFGKYNPTEAVIIRRKQTGRSRGYGFVTFESKELLDGAMNELNGGKLDDREVQIDISTSKGPFPEGSKRPARDAEGNEIATTSQRLIVQRLAWDVEDEQLKAAFEKFGEVEDARVIRNRRNGRSRGYGFVTFKTEEDGKSAMEGMDGNQELGFTTTAADGDEELKQGIRVVEARSSGPRPEGEDSPKPARRRRRREKKTDGGDDDDTEDTRPGPRRIFVRDLNEETTEETLTETFGKYGTIKNVRLIMDRESGKSRGLAYVTYEEHEDFKKAIEAYAEGGKIEEAEVQVSRAFPSRQGRGRGRGRGGRRRRGGGGRGGGGGKAEGPTDL